MLQPQPARERNSTAVRPSNPLASSGLIRGASASASASIAWTVFIHLSSRVNHARVGAAYSSAKRITSTKANIGVNNAMVKAITPAFRWRRKLLENGTHATIAEILPPRRSTNSFGRVLRPTFLAPDLVEAVFEWAADAGAAHAAVWPLHGRSTAEDRFLLEN
jgi:hypothetical protein